MCNRYTLAYKTADVAERFEALAPADFDAVSFNIAPTDKVAVVTDDDQGRTITGMRWGFVPFFAKPEPNGKMPKGLMNVRAETMMEKPMFRSRLQTGRCILPASGFFEWSGAAGQKLPWHFQLDDGSLFGFAGLWSAWKNPDQSKILTCAIITTVPNELVADVHNRMPVILRHEDEAAWLSPRTGLSELPSMLLPYPAQAMRKIAVGNALNDPRYKGVDCVAPASTGLFD